MSQSGLKLPTRTAPSRDFMVRQAILNAMDYWKPFYSREWLKERFYHHFLRSGAVPHSFHQTILSEFRKLACRYDLEAVDVLFKKYQIDREIALKAHQISAELRSRANRGEHL